MLVAVDPGHIGYDAGNVNNGRKEVEYTWPVSLFFGDALKKYGIDIVMTRNFPDKLPYLNSVNTDLNERCNIANEKKTDLFISWHNDSFSNPEVNGIAAWIHPSSKGTDTEILAKKIVDAITQATGQVNRGVRTSDFAVLTHTVMPAILIEGGFNSNPGESAKLVDTSFQKLQAEVAAKMVAEHFGKVVQPVEQVSDWAKASWEKAIAKGIIKGDENGYNPQGTITREQLVVILDRVGFLD